MKKAEAIIAWSSGKDSAWALHEVRQSGEFDIVAALTTVTRGFNRVSMHGMRTELLLAQIQASGLTPLLVEIPWPCTNAAYEAAMNAQITESKNKGVTHIIFGDLFLQDIRAYRERQLHGTGITPVFPLWMRETRDLARGMLTAGVEAYLTTVDLKKLPARFAGRRFEDALLAELGESDPCGENGEFHTFVFDGPLFSSPVPFRIGDAVLRDNFWFRDLIPEE